MFFDPLFKVGDDRNFSSMMYPYHLSAALSVLRKQITAASDSIQDVDQVCLDALRTLKKGLSRDYMLHRWIELSPNVDPGALLPSDFSDPTLYAALTAKNVVQKEVKTVVLDGIVYLNAQNEMEKAPSGDLLAHLAQKHPNKVLYIDAYATWCGPCIAEFKVSGTLHKVFESKDVVFVNLCLSSSQEKWLPTVERYQIDGQNYFCPKTPPNFL